MHKSFAFVLFSMVTILHGELVLKSSDKLNENLTLNIYENSDSPREYALKILDKDSKVVYENLDFTFSISHSKIGKKYIAIDRFSGGAHCCFDYSILELDEQNIVKTYDYNLGNCSVDEFSLNDNDELVFSSCDDSFAYMRDCFACSYFPVLIFKDNKLSLDEMRKPKPTKDDLKKIVDEIAKEDINPTDGVHVTLDNYMIELIYTGNLKSSLELFSMYNKRFPKKANSAFKKTLFNTFSNAIYFQDILKLNSISVDEYNKLIR